MMEKSLREIVFARSKGYCEFCGKPLPASWAIHHRKLRSRGGRDEVENLVALHHNCHNLGTKSVHLNPSMSEQKGFMVGSWQNPSECPLTLPSGETVILTAEGTYHYLEGKKDGW